MFYSAKSPGGEKASFPDESWPESVASACLRDTILFEKDDCISQVS